MVWNGCTTSDTDKLKKDQLHAARIVTSLPTLASKDFFIFGNWLGAIMRNSKKKKSQNYNNTQNEYKHSTSIPM